MTDTDMADALRWFTRKLREFDDNLADGTEEGDDA